HKAHPLKTFQHYIHQPNKHPYRATLAGIRTLHIVDTLTPRWRNHHQPTIHASRRNTETKQATKKQKTNNASRSTQRLVNKVSKLGSSRY
ncbi:hypothetical protein, partial [Corynebacterium macclintockiae]|uniref:hypothetical protein n=1 Tax=Corynebacterium macclintockiae TaxID=2913501 RepID=UPI003EBFC4C0